MGQVRIEDFFSSIDAKEVYERKFYEKTGIKWEERGRGIRIEGKYQIVDVQATKEEMGKLIQNERKMQEMLEESRRKETQLDPPVAEFMHLIWDTDRLKREVIGQ